MGRVALRIRVKGQPGRRTRGDSSVARAAMRSWKALGRPAHLPATVPLDLRAG